MGTISEEAMGYESEAKINNISELEFIQTSAEVKEEKDAEFPYKYFEIEGLRYKIPKSVLQNLKAILEENKDLKKFKVKKTGEGMDTRYTVIPLT